MAQLVGTLSRRAVTCVAKQRITGVSPVWGSRTVVEAKLLAAHWPPLHTVHLESIQMPWLFPHFFTLQPYSKIDSTFLFYQKRQKQVFRNVCTSLKIKKQKYLIYISIQTLCYEARNWAWSSLEMFLQLDRSSPVINSIDWTWFGKAHTCLYKVPQLTVHVRAKTKPRGQRNCL